MASPMRNPFYPLLLAACAALLVTMLVYLVGWAYVPNSAAIQEPRSPMPQWMRWVDGHAMILIAVEVVFIFVLTVLLIGLDRYFDPQEPKANQG